MYANLDPRALEVGTYIRRTTKGTYKEGFNLFGKQINSLLKKNWLPWNLWYLLPIPAGSYLSVAVSAYY